MVTIRDFFDWSEVWMLLIPLTILLIKKRNYPRYLKPVIIYIIITFFINLAATLMWKGQKFMYIPVSLRSNTVLYNVHAIVQFLFFSWFFIRLDQPYADRLKKIIPLAFILFVIINFSFFEKFYNYYSISSHLHATDVALLLVYCLLYFLYLLQEDSVLVIQKQKGFWVVSALTIHVTVNFFIFLFYATLIMDPKNNRWAENIWDVHNATYLILCICIAKTFYEQPEK